MIPGAGETTVPGGTLAAFGSIASTRGSMYCLYVWYVHMRLSESQPTQPTTYVPREKLTHTHAFSHPPLLLLLLPNFPRRCAGRERMPDPRVHWPARLLAPPPMSAAANKILDCDETMWPLKLVPGYSHSIAALQSKVGKVFNHDVGGTCIIVVWAQART